MSAAPPPDRPPTPSAPPPSQQPPSAQSSSAPAQGSPGPQRPAPDEETRTFYAKFLGWLVLVIIVAYAGLQLPVPWRLMTLAAALVGVVGGVVLLVQSIRRRLSRVVLIGAVLVILSCSFFLVSAGVQAIFWEASVAFEECMRTAVTDRALNRCFTEYEQDIFSSIPGLP